MLAIISHPRSTITFAISLAVSLLNVKCTQSVNAHTETTGHPDTGTIDTSLAVTIPVDASVSDTSVTRRRTPSWTDFVQLRNDPVLHQGVIGTTVHAPEGFDPSRPFHIVMFFRGIWGCTAAWIADHPARCREGGPEFAGGWLGWRHDQAGTNSLFVAPQFGGGAAHVGNFARVGGFRAYIEELLQETLRERLRGPHSLEEVEGITLIGASAGGSPTAAILRTGDLSDKIHNVVLYDASYHSVSTYVQWLSRSTRERPYQLFCAYTWGTTEQNCLAIGHQAQGLRNADVHFTRSSVLTAQDLSHRVVIFSSREANHGDMVWTYFIRVMQALDLPTR